MPAPGGAMTRETFLRALDELTVWRRGDERAPHKPLLLLLTLGRLASGLPRLADYQHEIRAPLADLLRRFGPSRQSHHPEFPFYYLKTSGFWEITNAYRLRPDRLAGDLSRHPSAGGFTEPAHRLLAADPELREEAAMRLLSGHFPESLHLDIRDEMNLPDLMAAEVRLVGFRRRDARPRDPGFRRAVLTAYERRCAICDFDIRIEDDLLAVDAAHIKWHAAGGPDETPNGLALCAFHHRALDRGAIGLAPRTDAPRFALLVSRELSGQSDAFHELVRAGGRLIRDPQAPRFRPARPYVEWHRAQVFRGEPRGA